MKSIRRGLGARSARGLDQFWDTALLAFKAEVEKEGDE